MANSRRFHAHHRAIELIEFTSDELVSRLINGQPLSWRQKQDAERLLLSRCNSAHDTIKTIGTKSCY